MGAEVLEGVWLTVSTHEDKVLAEQLYANRPVA